MNFLNVGDNDLKTFRPVQMEDIEATYLNISQNYH